MSRRIKQEPLRGMSLSEFFASLSTEEFAERKIAIAKAIEKTDSLIKATAEYQEAIAKVFSESDPIFLYPLDIQLDSLQFREQKMIEFEHERLQGGDA